MNDKEFQEKMGEIASQCRFTRRGTIYRPSEEVKEALKTCLNARIREIERIYPRFNVTASNRALKRVKFVEVETVSFTGSLFVIGLNEKGETVRTSTFNIWINDNDLLSWHLKMKNREMNPSNPGKTNNQNNETKKQPFYLILPHQPRNLYLFPSPSGLFQVDATHLACLSKPMLR